MAISERQRQTLNEMGKKWLRSMGYRDEILDDGVGDLLASICNSYTPITVKTSAFTPIYSELAHVDPTSGPFSVSLPTATEFGFIFIKNVSDSSNLVTLTCHTSDTIDGASSITLDAREAVLLISDGTNWIIQSKYSPTKIPSSLKAEVVADTRIVIYVSSTGNDSTGDGSVGNPYQSIQHAINQVPQFAARGTRYVIDVTDSLGEGVTIAGFCSPTRQANFSNPDFVPFGTEGYLTFQAVPTVYDTFTASGTVAADQALAFRILTLPGIAYDQNELVGKWLWRQGTAKFAPIAWNNGNIIIVADSSSTSWTGSGVTYNIVEPTPAITATIENCTSQIRFNGISASITANNALDVQLLGSILFTLNDEESNIHVDNCYGNTLSNLPATSIRTVFNTCNLYNGGNYRARRKFTVCGFNSCVYQGGTESTSNIREQQPMSEYQQCRWSANGLRVVGGHARIWNSGFWDIIDEAAIEVTRRALVELVGVVNTSWETAPSTLALKVTDNSLVWFPGVIPTFFTGAGVSDFKVGRLESKLWSAFDGNEFDIFGDGSRVAQAGFETVPALKTYNMFGGIYTADQRPYQPTGYLFSNATEGGALQVSDGVTGGAVMAADGLLLLHDQAVNTFPGRKFLWPLDEESGLVATSTDGLANGTIAIGGGSLLYRQQPVTRRSIRGSLEHTGATGASIIADATNNWNLGFTIMLAIEPRSVVDTDTLWISNNVGLFFQSLAGGSLWDQSATIAPAGSLVQYRRSFVIVRGIMGAAGNIVLDVDGARTTTATNYGSGGSDFLQINFKNARLGWVSLWERQLTDAEVDALTKTAGRA
jgi:hypothetical protein